MKSILLRAILLFLAMPKLLNAQKCDPILTNSLRPQKDFEIVSILVDACDGNKEGQNEMIRLHTGKQTLSVKDFLVPDYKSGLVNWGSSSNPWRGFSSLNSNLTSKINTLNANIRSANNCGFFKFLGPQDKVPPYSDVLIITSADFNPNAHDFAGLNDTVMLLIQNSGNTAGHFANYSGTSSTRTFILFNKNKSDTVVYNINSLIKQNKSKGSEDGAGVDYSYNGVPVYVNYGCKIPYPNFTIDAGKDLYLNCDDSCIVLKGSFEGYSCVRWFTNVSGGYFKDSTQAISTYCPPINSPKEWVMYFEGRTSCGKKDVDSVLIINTSTLPKALFEVDSTFKPVWTFKNQSINADDFLWKITNSNGFDSFIRTKSLQDNPILKLQLPGKYSICLVAYNSKCTDTFCQFIDVNRVVEPYIYIANVFTPGYLDGINDELRVESEGLIFCNLKIFSRWGTTVFESSELNPAWNGKIQNVGEPLPAGNYFYILDFQLQGQPLKSINGVINLIR